MMKVTSKNMYKYGNLHIQIRQRILKRKFYLFERCLNPKKIKSDKDKLKIAKRGWILLQNI